MMDKVITWGGGGGGGWAGLNIAVRHVQKFTHLRTMTNCFTDIVSGQCT